MPWPPGIWWGNNKENYYIGVYMGKLGLYYSIERCGHWGFLFNKNRHPINTNF
jgi:hypothetical protein